MGHNPDFVLNTLIEYYKQGQGLATGFPGQLQKELAEILSERLATDKIRFTTSGTLATMYAIMLAKAHTGKDLVLKIGGGWHGAQPYALKGISDYQDGLDRVESAGLSAHLGASIITSRFNDVADLEEKFDRYGRDIACLIIEPFVGAGGFIFGSKNYIQKTREITKSYGAVLIFDEVVSGFRFHPGGVQTLYGVKPDLTVLGKAIGGGMPVSALAGRESVMGLCDPRSKSNRRVKFEGGTFSAHPSCMLAGITYLRYLIKNAANIYPRIGRFGRLVREQVELIFRQHGFLVRCTGGNEDIIQNSSIVGVHFLKEDLEKLTTPEEVWNPDVNDFALRENIFKLAMLQEGFNIFHGFGTISYAHSEAEIQAALSAVERIAADWRKS